MSFILDALRKSESERQREATPTLSRAPLAAVRRETPSWIWIVIGVLTVALAAIGIGWWQTIQPTDETAAIGAPMLTPGEPVTTIGQPAPIASVQRTAAPTAQATTPATTQAAGGTVVDGAADEPRSIGDLETLYPNLPRLSLQFIEYNARDPAQGSAWINGSIFRPGETITGGPELVEVRADSVVIGYGGRTFLLRLR